MGLGAEGAADPGDRRPRQLGLVRRGPCGPVGVLSTALLRQRRGDHDLRLLVSDLPRRPGTRRVRQPVPDEPDPPLAPPAIPGVRAATFVSGATPPSSAQARTILARAASDCGAVRLRAIAARDSRSLSVSTRGTGFGPGISRASKLQRCFRLKISADAPVAIRQCQIVLPGDKFIRAARPGLAGAARHAEWENTSSLWEEASYTADAGLAAADPDSVGDRKSVV